MRRSLAAVLLALLAVLLVACRPEPLPVLGQAPTFTLVDQLGDPISDDMFIDRVGVVGFIYTNCDDSACDILTSRMAQLYRELEASGDRDRVEFMSFTVDPRRDTPDVLAQYAAERNAPWKFVTGTEPAVRQAVTGGWKVAYFPRSGVEGSITHQAPLFLVDGQRRVRALYTGTDATPARVMEDIRRLLAEQG